MLKPRKSGRVEVWSADGTRRLSKPMSREKAEKRLRQVEYFARRDSKKRIGRVA